MSYNRIMIKLVIFDVDGVVLDSETLFLKAAAVNSKVNGYDLPDELLNSIIGTGEERHHQIVGDYIGEGFDPKKYNDDLMSVWAEIKQNEPPKPKKGLHKLMDHLMANDIHIALATSTKKERQLKDLKNAKVDHYFEFMVFGDDITRHKPDPEIYQIVVDHYGIPKDEILIIEDSINGILSAVNCGIKVIYIPDNVKVPEEIEKQAYCKLEDLSQVIDVIEDLKKE